VDHIEHAWFLVDEDGNQRYDPKIADKLARSGARVSATLAVGRHFLRDMRERAARDGGKPADTSRWERMLADNIENVRRLSVAGVPFVTGTDAGWGSTPFTAIVDELELLHEAGISTSEAIVAATSRAAKALAIDDQTGHLAPGMDSDIIAVQGNPLDDLGTLRTIRLVIKQGDRYVDAREPAISREPAIA
jgi:imidazolonepropionase-like amidohydrolase